MNVFGRPGPRTPSTARATCGATDGLRGFRSVGGGRDAYARCRAGSSALRRQRRRRRTDTRQFITRHRTARPPSSCARLAILAQSSGRRRTEFTNYYNKNNNNYCYVSICVFLSRTRPNIFFVGQTVFFFLFFTSVEKKTIQVCVTISRKGKYFIRIFIENYYNC